MFNFKDINLFDIDAEAFVNPINTLGVVSGGIEFQFKKKFKKNFISYKEAIAKNKIKISKVFITKNPSKFIINFPIKEDWRDPIKMEDVESGLIDMKSQCEKLKISTIASPILVSSSFSENYLKEFKNLIENIFTDSKISIIISQTTFSD